MSRSVNSRQHDVALGGPLVARTRLAKGMTGDSPLKAHAPTQALAHALREGDAPPDVWTTIAAIPTPSSGVGCRGQRQPLPAHLVDEAVTATDCMPGSTSFRAQIMSRISQNSVQTQLGNHRIDRV